MHGYMQTFPQEKQKKKRAKNPVDNSEFSTISTGFSTGVFHRRGMLWICSFGSHKKIRHASTDFPLSAGRGFTMNIFCAKLRLDNSPRRPRRPPTGAGWPGRSFLRPERQKILKKGLILSRQGVIMRICMENEQKEVESMPNIKSSKKVSFLPRSLTRRTRLTSPS